MNYFIFQGISFSVGYNSRYIYEYNITECNIYTLRIISSDILLFLKTNYFILCIK